jgi:hypothetical protein
VISLAFVRQFPEPNPNDTRTKPEEIQEKDRGKSEESQEKIADYSRIKADEKEDLILKINRVHFAKCTIWSF